MGLKIPKTENLKLILPSFKAYLQLFKSLTNKSLELREKYKVTSIKAKDS